MVAIVEDYVSFETAKLLKDKGFNEEIEYIFSNNGELLKLSHFGIKDLTNVDCNDYHTWQFPIEGVASIISAPTQAMAMKWLREVHKLSVRPRYDEVEDEKEQLHYVWFFDILSMKPYKTLAEPIQGYSSYEEACEAAIKYCLENLIK